VSTGRKKRRQLFLHIAAGRRQGCGFHNNDGQVPKRSGPQVLGLQHRRWHRLAERYDGHLRENHISEWTSRRKGDVERR